LNALNDDLLVFAHAIVRGDELPHEINSAYPKYTAATAIDVYRNNYCGNLNAALAGAYPVIEQLVGKDFFRLLTRQFIGQHPSRSGNLHHYGEEMASFVAAFESARGLVYLADIASLEWACHCSYFAPDAGVLDIGRLSRISQEHYPSLVLLTHPACHVVRSNYPIADIWHAHQPGAPGDFHIDLDSGPCIALVSRKDDVVVVGEMTQADAAWLQSIQAGAPLGTATDATLERYPEFDLQAALLTLVSQDVLTGFS
jgi:hypothetical protein